MGRAANPSNEQAWAENYARAMAAAAPYTAARREAAHAVSIHNRAEGAKRLCGIKGCKRHAHKGRLCRAHLAMVPYEEKERLAMDCAQAERRCAERAYSRWFKLVQAEALL